MFCQRLGCINDNITLLPHAQDLGSLRKEG